MLLAADIGNTNITLGIFDGDTLVKTFRLISDINMSAEDYENTLRSLLEGINITESAVSSVVDELTPIIKQVFEKIIGKECFMLNSDTVKGLKLNPEAASTIGADRLANACGALKYKLPVIVVDVGTAVTFDIISEEREFLGGIIMPGINMKLKALKDYTSKLPQITAGRSPKAIGYTTETCILSGVIRGTACAIDGLIVQCEKELGQKTSVILTGGQAELVAEYMTRVPEDTNKNLTLEGLKTNL